jgi:hypothetical protein
MKRSTLKCGRYGNTRTSANAVRLQLHALAYNLGNFLRTLATPEPMKDWSLTSLKEKLIKIGAKNRSKKTTRSKRSTTSCSAAQTHQPNALRSSCILKATLTAVRLQSPGISIIVRGDNSDETSSLEVWSSPTIPSLGIGRYGALVGAECGSSAT